MTAETFLQYVNNFDEVMSGDDNDFEVLSGTQIVERIVKLDQIISEPDVIKIKPKSRKCLFDTEPQSGYYDVIEFSH
jgi:hypothetical protein